LTISANKNTSKVIFVAVSPPPNNNNPNILVTNVCRSSVHRIGGEDNKRDTRIRLIVRSDDVVTSRQVSPGRQDRCEGRDVFNLWAEVIRLLVSFSLALVALAGEEKESCS
jgi:hypothetical protein